MKKFFVWILLSAAFACYPDKDRISSKLREELMLKSDWYFLVDSVNAGLTGEWFKSRHIAENGQIVSVPHTWNIQDGLEEYTGSAWYQKTFFLPEQWKEGAIRLICNSINRDARIWLNGNLVREHFGSGYTSFNSRIEKNLVYGEENSLVIQVTNRYSKNSIPFLNSFDWPNDGGIIRDIFLQKTDKLFIENVLINPVLDPDGNGRMLIRIKIGEMDGAQLKKLDIWYHVEQNNTPILKGNKSLSVKDSQVLLEIKMNRVQPWHFNYPNLYQLQLAIGSGMKLTDHFTESVGFRQISVEGSAMILNGEKVRLPGLEWMPGSDPGYGFAEDSSMFNRMLSMLKNTNSVITRFHWQQDEDLLDWCDRNGLLVQEEIPLWGRPWPEDINDTLYQLAVSQATEMVFNHYHHPSIMAWGIGNELRSNDTIIYQFIRDLYAEVRQLDTTRLINYVSNCFHASPDFDGTSLGDVMMWNDYTGLWYGTGPGGFGEDRLEETLIRIGDLNPAKPLIISEYGLCEPVFTGGDPRRIGHMKYHTEVYEKYNFVAGLIYFSLNDYRTHIGEEGEGRFRQRVHGVVDLDGNKKPSYDTLTRLFSPVRNLVSLVSDDKIHIRGNNHDGIPSYTLSGFSARLVSMANNEALSGYELPVLLPGEPINVVFDRPPAGTYLVNFYTGNGWKVADLRIHVE